MLDVLDVPYVVVVTSYLVPLEAMCVAIDPVPSAPLVGDPRAYVSTSWPLALWPSLLATSYLGPPPSIPIGRVARSQHLVSDTHTLRLRLRLPLFSAPAPTLECSALRVRLLRSWLPNGPLPVTGPLLPDVLVPYPMSPLYRLFAPLIPCLYTG